MLKVLGKNPRSLIVQYPDGSKQEIHPSDFRGAVSVGHTEQIELAAGDRIRFTAADKIQVILNGDRGEVSKIVDGTAYVLLDRTNEVVTVTIDGPDPVQIRHAYAFTGHSFQGGTARMKLGKDNSPLNDNANVIYYLNKSDRNAFYTIGTRPADKLHVVMAVSSAREIDQVRKCISRTKEKNTAEKLLTGGADKPAEQLAYLAQAKGDQIWKRLDLPRDATPTQIADLLRLAQFQYGDKLFVSGSKTLQKTVAQIAGRENIGVRFDDKTIDGYRSKENEKVIGKVLADGNAFAGGNVQTQAEQGINVINTKDWVSRKGYAEHVVCNLKPAVPEHPEVIRFFRGTYPNAPFTVQQITNPGSRDEVRKILFKDKNRKPSVSYFNDLLIARGIAGQELIRQEPIPQEIEKKDAAEPLQKSWVRAVKSQSFNSLLMKDADRLSESERGALLDKLRQEVPGTDAAKPFQNGTVQVFNNQSVDSYFTEDAAMQNDAEREAWLDKLLQMDKDKIEDDGTR
jgi:hypothetical protein